MLQEPVAEAACRLESLGVIRARGAEAAAFLQGQLTNDVLGLDAARARLAAFCSAKGRMQASFVVWRGEGDEILLACSRDLLTATLKRLSMFVLRAKCRLDDASGEIALWGLAGAAAARRVGDLATWQRATIDGGGGGATIRLPDAGGVVRALHAQAAGAPPPAPTALPDDDWQRLEVLSAAPMIVAATVDRFVPQMVNFELLGGVDFRKGCYPGQEVVARSQYRGTVKRRALLFDCDEGSAAAGQDVHADGSVEPVGTVVQAAPAGTGGVVLVELRLAALELPLRLGAADGPSLRRRAMPYAVPVEAEAAA